MLVLLLLFWYWRSDIMTVCNYCNKQETRARRFTLPFTCKECEQNQKNYQSETSGDTIDLFLYRCRNALSSLIIVGALRCHLQLWLAQCVVSSLIIIGVVRCIFFIVGAVSCIFFNCFWRSTLHSLIIVGEVRCFLLIIVGVVRCVFFNYCWRSALFLL